MQDALDYGEVLIDQPESYERQGKRHTLIAYYEDDGWWRHVIEVRHKQLLLLTAFRDEYSDIRTEDVLRRPGLVTVRDWDENRWRDRPKESGK